MAPAPPPHGRFQLILIAVGICLLVVWVLLGLSRRTKLGLRNCPGRPNSLTPVHVLLLLAAWALTSVGLAELLALRLEKESLELRMLSSTAAHAVLLAAGLALAAKTFRGGLLRGLGLSLRHWPWDLARGIAGFLIIVPVTVGLHALTKYMLPADLIEEHELLTAAGTMPTFWAFLAVFAAVVAAPVAEEVFYRGLLQSMVRRYAAGPWAAIFITAAIFALAHLDHPDTLPALFALGVALGYNYERSGRLLSPIVMHGAFNAVNVISKVTGW